MRNNSFSERGHFLLDERYVYRDLNLLGVKGSCMSRNVSIARLQFSHLQHMRILKGVEEDILKGI